MHAAATVLLLRERDGELEALMMRRGSSLSFMAGMWVFPGGRVDAADRSAGARARLLAPGRPVALDTLRTPQGEPLPPEETAALYVAACRETFEEAGVLLARGPAGEPCDPARVGALQQRRAAIVERPAAFVELLEAEGLYLDVGQLVYWSHWITPSLEPKRFDTRFFAIRVPEEQAASADLSELTDHAWIRPAGIHEAVERRVVRVVPPTLFTLEDLAEAHARHGSLAGMLAAERGRGTPAILPRIDVAADAYRVVMPWDPGYGEVGGEGCVPAEPFPAHLARRASSITVARDRDVRGQ